MRLKEPPAKVVYKSTRPEARNDSLLSRAYEEQRFALGTERQKAPNTMGDQGEHKEWAQERLSSLHNQFSSAVQRLADPAVFVFGPRSKSRQR